MKHSSDLITVSVLMPVYNSAQYLHESILSILNQSYSNLELIIINDGSSDNSEEIIKTFDDKRIKYYYQSNMGLAKTLNRGIEIASGELIARQDPDDISEATRLEKQVRFLNENADYALVGTWADIIDEKGIPTGRLHKHSVLNNDIKLDLCFNNPFVHSTVMFRKKIIWIVGNYNETEHSIVQDYDLWYRISVSYKVSNIPETLLKYREVNAGISKTTANSKLLVAEKSHEIIHKYLGSAFEKEAKYLSHLNQGIFIEEEIRNKLGLSFSSFVDKLGVIIYGSLNELNKNLHFKSLKSKLIKLHYSNLAYGRNVNLVVRIFYKILLRLIA